MFEGQESDNHVLNRLDQVVIASQMRPPALVPVSYTHLRAHETVLDLVCRLLLEKKKHRISIISRRIMTVYREYCRQTPQRMTRSRRVEQSRRL